jgi:hypothetical protein
MMTLEIFVLYAIIILQTIVISRLVYKLKNKQEISKPESLKIIFIRKENNMALVYGLSCEAPVDSDVVNRRLVVNVNGNDVAKNTYSSDVVDFGEFTFSQGDDVVMILVDIDDAGNESDPATVQFQAVDTIPPRVPGGFSVSLLREVEDTTPAPTTPEPEPVVETTPEPVVETTPDSSPPGSGN